jgi:hypothetical protein
MAMYSIPTPSNHKGMILNETLIYENQNLKKKKKKTKQQKKKQKKKNNYTQFYFSGYSKCGKNIL